MTMPNFKSEAGIMACQGCHTVRPITLVSYTKHTGLIIIGRITRHRGLLCEQCNKRLFSSCLIHCLTAGWWGIISFFIYNPVAIIGNIIMYFRAKNRFKKYSSIVSTSSNQ
jgi:hypothetical protein